MPSFRETGHRVIDLLADHLDRAHAREQPVLPWRAPDAMLREWPAEFPERAEGDLPAFLARVIEQSIHLHDPRYIGHQVSAPDGEAAICDMVSSLLNNGMAVYEMGAAATVMEKAVLRWMNDRLGLGPEAGGLLTSGGSLGNLTALLAARQAAAGWDAWTDGDFQGASPLAGQSPASLPDHSPLSVLVAETAHYSIQRAVQIMGWGRAGAIPVPVDDRFRLRPETLGSVQTQAERDGRRVIAVVACASSTSTGAFDPIEPIADYCATNKLWLHVDGAHGAAAALSPSPAHRELVRGIDRADSVVWDAHKMMLMPALITAVLFRDDHRADEAFAQKASYLYDEHEHRWWDIGQRTIECTKKMMGLKLYASLALRGTARIGEHVRDTFDRAARFAERLAAAGDFDVVAPDANIVCFRLRGVSDAEHDRVRAQIIESGRFYLVRTRLPAGVFLRVTIMNPLTTDEDLDVLADLVRSTARRDA